jgi:hypothetical protein
LGRSQAVRQRILIPPFGGSIPPAPASHSFDRAVSQRDAGIARKCGLFAHWLESLGGGSAEAEAKIGGSLRPIPRIFPFRGDFRQRPKFDRGLPPDERSQLLARGVGLRVSALDLADYRNKHACQKAKLTAEFLSRSESMTIGLSNRWLF